MVLWTLPGRLQYRQIIMGQEITSATFCQSDYEQFAQRLRNESDILQVYFKDKVFDGEPPRLGVELEGCLVDKDCNPAAESESLITNINDKSVVPELAKYNFEINSEPFELNQFCLQRIHQNLDSLWQLCFDQADAIDLSAVAIGILPTYQQQMLTKEYIYPRKRYYALEEALAKYRKGQPIVADIHGIDYFCQTFDSVLFEAVATSLQIHVQVGLHNSVRMYNAAQIISAPLIAVSANSPFLFGKNLWCDTRIPVFEQAAATPFNQDGKPNQHKRVTFGHRFVKESLFELFQENLESYLILLPELSNEPDTVLHHLRLHNGTIWRWNRALIGMDQVNKPNLRIEHRVNPAGPSISDNVANVAFFIGLLNYYANTKIAPEQQIQFKIAADNFYKAAQYGLNSNIVWLNDKTVPMSSLLLDELLPNAKLGLAQLNIDSDQSDYYLNIIKGRVVKQITGSSWQRKFIAKYGIDFNNMLYCYIDNQMNQQAVHQWKL